MNAAEKEQYQRQIDIRSLEVRWTQKVQALRQPPNNDEDPSRYNPDHHTTSQHSEIVE